MMEPIDDESPPPDPEKVQRERHKFWFWSALTFTVGIVMAAEFKGPEHLPYWSVGRILEMVFWGFLTWGMWASTFGLYLTRRAFPDMRNWFVVTIVVVTAARAVARTFRRLFRR